MTDDDFWKRGESYFLHLSPPRLVIYSDANITIIFINALFSISLFLFSWKIIHLYGLQAENKEGCTPIHPYKTRNVQKLTMKRKSSYKYNGEKNFQKQGQSLVSRPNRIALWTIYHWQGYYSVTNVTIYSEIQKKNGYKYTRSNLKSLIYTLEGYVLRL